MAQMADLQEIFSDINKITHFVPVVRYEHSSVKSPPAFFTGYTNS
jgi:hypothetical protein